MDELDLIDRLRALAGPGALNLEDDAALLPHSSHHDIVISTDTMVEGVHFPAGRIGGGFSERLLRVALSDLAAKAARPTHYMLSLTWPKGRDARWLNGFVTGLSEAQQSFDITLLGGDTTSGDGPLVATATVFGVVPKGQMVTRSGARVGDQVWYTGRLGLAGKGLDIFLGRPTDLIAVDQLNAEAAYLRPEPRFVLRKILREHATACADISDGILSEAGHIASASHACVDLTAPLPDGHIFGDDYELLFTARAESEEALRQASKTLGLPLTLCGEVVEGAGVRLNGNPIEGPTGFRHTL